MRRTVPLGPCGGRRQEVCGRHLMVALRCGKLYHGSDSAGGRGALIVRVLARLRQLYDLGQVAWMIERAAAGLPCEKRRAGELRPDPGQELAAEKLQSIHNALRHYRPSSGAGGWKERLGLGRRRVEPPQGLYIFGGVGTGKSMLMDLFFETAPVERKRRVHFHAFMLEVQERFMPGVRRAREKSVTPCPPWLRTLPRTPGCSASTSSMW